MPTYVFVDYETYVIPRSSMYSSDWLPVQGPVLAASQAAFMHIGTHQSQTPCDHCIEANGHSQEGRGGLFNLGREISRGWLWGADGTGGLRSRGL